MNLGGLFFAILVIGFSMVPITTCHGTRRELTVMPVITVFFHLLFVHHRAGCRQQYPIVMGGN